METKQYKKILVATDGSDNSMNAVSSAIELAKATGAELCTIYVVSDANLYAGIRSAYWADEMHEHFIKEGEEAIQYVKAEGGAANIEIGTFLLEGNAGEKIVDFAEANDIDLIVMGTRGKTAVERILVGSVAENVIRHSKVRVMVVP
ncbi:MAG: universal stress protein [ANME-2 cluster archaeon]|nr:universal stress protein [ANME-2 cluster archaeon]